LSSPPDDARIDLHLHSTASDGTCTPEELVVKAKALGLVAIAITDHDSVGAVRDGLAAGERHGIEVVSGVEIGIAHDPDRGLVEVDILGYFVDPEHEELARVLARLQDAKNDKLQRQLNVLAENGLIIDAAEVIREAAGDTVRRPHIWKVLSRHYPDFGAEDFFDRTSFGGEWHVTKAFSLTLEDSVTLIERAGGVSVMAHPGAYNATFAKGGELVDPAVDAAIHVCAGAGVRGLEVYYPYSKGRPFHDDGPLIDEAQLSRLIGHYETRADEHGLLKTGGTDYHGASKPHIEIGEIEVPYRLLKQLKNAVP
jgi:predicted metal-dependent phosphoesterase TrpH